MGKLKQLKKYPIMLLFFAFLAIFTLADLLTPDKTVSELENRPLTQAPAFNWESFTNNQWTKEYGEYTKDQLLGRDGWISMQSALESAQGKLENGGVWYADDDYQIAKNTIFSTVQQQTLPVNTQAICELSQRYPGRVTAMVVPSPANILSYKLPWNPPQYNENELLDETFASMRDAGANVIDLREPFLANSENDLFYKTDHHWTTGGGAFLAYQQFCESQGQTAVEPTKPLAVEVDNFLGTNFAKTKRFDTKPDTILYYDFNQPLTVFSLESDGSVQEDTGPLMDVSKFDTYDKYSAFLRGNNGYSELAGEGEGSVLVIKDSYGNSFVPYLTQNYAKIGVIDLRAWVEVDSVIDEGNYDDILVLYSFDVFSQDSNAKRMLTSVQQP